VPQDFDRQCIFIGTTNDPHPLRDVENRRFMPVQCIKADISWIRANRDQLWAESLVRYEKKESWWVSDPALQIECAKIQEFARSDDAWESILADKLASHSKTTIQDAAEKLEVKMDRLDRATQTRIAIILKTIGFVRKRESSGNRSWFYERVIPVASSQPY
jgi:predicted P-loop ATPase